MKVLVADRLPEQTMQALTGLGLIVDNRPDLTSETLPTAMEEANVVIVRSTHVTAEAVEAGPCLHLVIRAGAGTNTIDCEAAARAAVHVANCPGKNAVAVAELTLGLILSLDRFIPDNVSSLRDGRWEKGRFSKGQGLLGRTIGVIGAGRIGQEVLARARAFGMKRIAYDPFLTSEGAAALEVGYCESVLDLCARADVITVHVPMTPETRHLIGEEAFAAMAPGSLFVHMARGGIVDDAAMKAAVDRGHIRAASDVFEEEPKGSAAGYEGPFRDLSGFYGTHHIGASTAQAQEAIGEEVVQIIDHWMRTGQVSNCVNRADRSPASGQLLVRHLDRVGVLALVLDVLREADISVKEMENMVFDDTGSAVASITLDRNLENETMERIRKACPNVLGLLWVANAGG